MILDIRVILRLSVASMDNKERFRSDQQYGCRHVYQLPGGWAHSLYTHWGNPSIHPQFLSPPRPHFPCLPPGISWRPGGHRNRVVFGGLIRQRNEVDGERSA